MRWHKATKNRVNQYSSWFDQEEGFFQKTWWLFIYRLYLCFSGDNESGILGETSAPSRIFLSHHHLKKTTQCDKRNAPKSVYSHRWIQHLALSSAVLRVSQRSGHRCVYQFSGEGRGIKRGTDVSSCRPDYGVEWMVGEQAEFGTRRGLQGGYSGLG